VSRVLPVAAIQLAVRVADAAHNLAACERLALQAVRAGARWIALPEFFNTGVLFAPALCEAIEPDDGAAANFLRDFSAAHGVVIGGSFLCRLPDGSVRNRYQCWHGGQLLGRHDKDLPTMWENAFYEGGAADDTGELGPVDGVRVGAAVCWEFMRSATARRLQGRVDLLVGGSCWWSIPDWVPGRARLEARNSANAIACVQDTARLLGVPVLHAAHCGAARCAMPGMPWLPDYRGCYEGHAAIVAADGTLLAHRTASEGEGIVLARVDLGRQPAAHELPPVPARYWLRSRGLLPALAWHQQRWSGRRWYARHVRGDASLQ
jgi:predicted amidohydrolase